MKLEEEIRIIHERLNNIEGKLNELHSQPVGVRSVLKDFMISFVVVLTIILVLGGVFSFFVVN